MKRVVFVFMTEGGTKGGDSWSPQSEGYSKHLDANSLPSEGLYWMLKELKKRKIIDELLLVIESPHKPGYFTLDGNRGYIVPHIKQINPFLRKGDILFIRGGFRGWHDWLEAKKGKYWLVLYGANTGRERWPWWDIILDDTSPKPLRIDNRGRIWFPFRKPVDYTVFRPLDLPLKYDFCIGASYVHDKKGQWRVVKALEIYKKKYGKMPKCVLPGAPRRGTESIPAYDRASKLGIDVVGRIPRTELNLIFNSTKIFIHMGNSGQNDRGPIEAMRCGCKLILASPKYHSPYLHCNPNVCYIPRDPENFESISQELNSQLRFYNEHSKKEVMAWFDLVMGEEVIIKNIEQLFSVLFLYSPPSTNLIDKEHTNETSGGYLQEEFFQKKGQIALESSTYS